MRKLSVSIAAAGMTLLGTSTAVQADEVAESQQLLDTAKSQVDQLAESESKLGERIDNLTETLDEVDTNYIPTSLKANLEQKRKLRNMMQIQRLNLQSQLDNAKEDLEKAQEVHDKIVEETKPEEPAPVVETPQAETPVVQEQPVAVAAPSGTSGEVALADFPMDFAGAYSYPVGQCTWGAKVLAPWAGPYWGNGAQWGASAAAEGFRVDGTPEIGAIVSWNDGGYGHVAVVTGIRYVNGALQIQVGESNVNGNQYIANHRGWFSPYGIQGAVSFIHPK